MFPPECLGIVNRSIPGVTYDTMAGWCAEHHWAGACFYQIDSTFPSIYLVALSPSGVPCAGDANCEVITLSPIRRHKRSDVPSVQPSVQPRRWDPRDSMCFRAPIHPPLPAVTSSLTAPPPEWRGKILRVRAWVRDGFWVRAQMVLK